MSSVTVSIQRGVGLSMRTKRNHIVISPTLTGGGEGEGRRGGGPMHVLNMPKWVFIRVVELHSLGGYYDKAAILITSTITSPPARF